MSDTAEEVAGNGPWPNLYVEMIIYKLREGSIDENEINDGS